MELYDIEAYYNIKPKSAIFDKRSRLINDKDDHGEMGIEGFWLQVICSILFNFNWIERNFNKNWKEIEWKLNGNFIEIECNWMKIVVDSQQRIGSRGPWYGCPEPD